MKKFDARDVKVFLLGMLTMFLITCAIEWRDVVEGFNDGMKFYIKK
jgi:hypothetical protein